MNKVCGNCVERMNCRMIHSGPASCEDYKLDEPAPKFETDGDAILELVTQLATIFATDQNGIAVYPDCIDRAVALLASHGQGERDEAAQEIRAAIALDKQTFEGVGRNTKGHARALMLIDEYRAALGQSSGEKS